MREYCRRARIGTTIPGVSSFSRWYGELSLFASFDGEQKNAVGVLGRVLVGQREILPVRRPGQMSVLRLRSYLCQLSLGTAQRGDHQDLSMVGQLAAKSDEPAVG